MRISDRALWYLLIGAAFAALATMGRPA